METCVLSCVENFHTLIVYVYLSSLYYVMLVQHTLEKYFTDCEIFIQEFMFKDLVCDEPIFRISLF